MIENEKLKKILEEERLERERKRKGGFFSRLGFSTPRKGESTSRPRTPRSADEKSTPRSGKKAKNSSATASEAASTNGLESKAERRERKRREKLLKEKGQFDFGGNEKKIDMQYQTAKYNKLPNKSWQQKFNRI